MAIFLTIKNYLGPVPPATNGSPDVKMEDADTNGHVDPGVSIRFGPVQGKDAGGGGDDADSSIAKRKSRTSTDQPRKSYAEPESSSEEDDQPLVRFAPLPTFIFFPSIHTHRGMERERERNASRRVPFTIG